MTAADTNFPLAQGKKLAGDRILYSKQALEQICCEFGLLGTCARPVVIAMRSMAT
jgi:hypothetical protein